MTNRTIIVDGLSVEVTDQGALAIEKLQGTIRDAAAAHAAAIAAKDAQIGTLTASVSAKDGEIAGLTSKLADAVLTPAKLDAAVADRAVVVTAAKAIIGDTFVADGKTDAAIRREAVNHKLGDAAKEFSDDAIAGAFKALVPAQDASTVNDPIRNVVRDGGGQIIDAEKKALDARQAMIDSYNPKVAA